MLNTSRNYPTTSAYPIACKYIGESIRHHCVCNVLIWHIRHKDLQTINNSGYYVNFTVIDEPILTQCIIMIISGCGSMVLTHREDGRYLNKDGQASEGLPISSGCRYSNHRKDFYSNTEFTVDEGRLYVHIFEKDMRWHHIEGFSFSLISRSGGYCGKSTVGPPVGGNTPTRSIVRSHILRDWRGNIFVPTDVIPSKSFPICTDLSMHKVDTLEIPPLFIQLKSGDSAASGAHATSGDGAGALAALFFCSMSEDYPKLSRRFAWTCWFRESRRLCLLACGSRLDTYMYTYAKISFLRKITT